MKPADPSGNEAEVLRLGLIEGVSVRRIAHHLNVSCWTVRKILGRHDVPRGPRLDLGETNIQMLDDTPLAGCVATRVARSP